MKSVNSEQAKRRQAPAGDRVERASYSGVASLASAAADSIESILRKIDGEVFRELKAIATDIETLRREIAKLQPRKLHRQSIPAAGKELDAIVTATEAASNRILECAEDVMAADASDAARYKALVAARMTGIFEACEFQDLTGQRIARIIDTLKQIETRVARFADAAQPERGAPRRARKARARNISQEAVDRLLNARKRR